MTPQNADPASPSINFKVRKLMLRRDCEARQKLQAFEALSDSVLKLLWESGLDPTVQALIESATPGGKSPTDTAKPQHPAIALKSDTP
jgi:hypothetical protein